jgi:hypothetical protein
MRAVWRHVRGEGGWEKTEHAGLHLTDPVTAPAIKEEALA